MECILSTEFRAGKGEDEKVRVAVLLLLEQHSAGASAERRDGLGQVRTSPVRILPFREQAHRGAGSSQLGGCPGVNPAHQASWAIHISRPRATAPPCTLGSCHNPNRQEKGTSSPFPARRQSQSPFPPSRWWEGMFTKQEQHHCLSSCIIPAMQKKGKTKLWSSIGDKNTAGHKKPYALKSLVLSWKTVHGVECLTEFSSGMQYYCKVAILPK